MPGFDEAKWASARAAAKKQHPTWDDKNPRLWKSVAVAYRSMGGELSTEMAKSMASMEAAARITPSFIEDPRLWVQALNKSIGTTTWDVQHLGLVIRAYALLGGRLMKSGMPDFMPTEAASAMSIAGQFEKGKQGSFSATHRYAERVEKPGGGYKYIYRGDDNKTRGQKTAEGTGHGYQKVPKRPGALGVVPEGQAASQGSMGRIVDMLNKKTESAQRASLQNVSDDNLSKLQSHASSHKGLSKLISEEKDRRRQADAKKKAEKKEKPAGDAKKSQETDFDGFSAANYDEVKTTLQKSHPEWDDATLLGRTEAQLRQLFKMRG